MISIEVGVLQAMNTFVLSVVPSARTVDFNSQISGGRDARTSATRKNNGHAANPKLAPPWQLQM
jgi:hypothetical protein